MIHTSFSIHCLLAVWLLTGCTAQGGDPPSTERRIAVRFETSLSDRPVTGRLFLLVTDREGIEPRKVAPFLGAYYFNAPRVGPEDEWLDYAPFFASDVTALPPGESVVIDDAALGFPFDRLSQLPPGEYFVQAVFHVYTEVTPAHGKTIHVPLDDWEGQQFHLSPGNFVSDVGRLSVDQGDGFSLDLTLDDRIPPIEPPADTEWVKTVRIRSELVSEFWGVDMHVGARVLLPRGYDESPEVRYPVLFYRGHFFEQQPFGFPMKEPAAPPPGAGDAATRAYESARALWDGWQAEDLPRFIVVTMQHPTPFYDDSYAVNSDNAGPWDDAIMQELIPHLEERFRMIGEPYARVMVGGSTGGWISLYAQIRHPDFFGGAWSYCPDWVDFSEVFDTNLYEEDNLFVPGAYRWLKPERIGSRTVEGQVRLTARQINQFFAALGTRGRSGEFIDAYAASFGPVGEDGYPKRPWDFLTGEIDQEVVRYWRDHGFDLKHHLEKYWDTLGPKLVGKVHLLCGDMDNFYLNLPMYRLEQFLESTTDPHYGGSFRWGRPMIGHQFEGMGLDPFPFATLKEMAEHIRRNAPAGADSSGWSH